MKVVSTHLCLFQKDALKEMADATSTYQVSFCIKRSEFFNEDGSLEEVNKINEMHATLQEELKVRYTFLENLS